MTTATTRRDRNAQPHRAPAAHHARAAAATLALLALLIGLPVLLVAVIGNPLPHHLPSGAQLHRSLVRPLADSTVVRILAVVAWLAWAHLLVNVARELWAQLRGLPAPRRFPVLGFNQAFAHQLVATALLLIPATASLHTTPVSALTRAAGEPYPTGPAHTAVSMTLAVDTAPGYEPVDRAVSRQESATPTATPHVPPQPAEPSAPHKMYVVQPPHGRHYDSLWDIADRHLGDGRRYREIYELNKGRPQPDGGELTRASLIHPGWVLLLPADATGPGVRELEDRTETPPATYGTRPATTSAHEVGRKPTTHSHNGHATAPQPRPAQTEPPSEPPPAGQHPAGNKPAPTVRSQTDHRDHGIPVAPIGVGLGLGSLAALAALQRARRIALRRRPLGQRPAPTPVELQPVEAGLRVEARRVDPIAAAVRLAVALASHREHDAEIEAVLRDDDGRIELRLSQPRPAPPPFTATDTGWLLTADATGFTFAVDNDADPLPGLLQLGRHQDQDVYVNVERAGYTTVDGAPDAVDDMLATAVARLVGAPWAGLTHAMIPSRLAGRVGPLERVEPIEDLASRADDLVRYATTVRTQLRGAGHVSVAVARSAGPADSVAILTLVGWHTDELPDEIVHAVLDPAVPLLAIANGSDARAHHQWRIAKNKLTGTGSTDPIDVAARPVAADKVAALIEHTHSAAVGSTDPVYIDLHEDAPPATSATDNLMSVDVLGPVELSGIDMPRRTPAFQTLVYLALHRRGTAAEQLSTALWPDELAAGKTVRNRVAEARAVVSGAISDGPGWRLEDTIGCDWQRFQTLAAGSAEQQLAALELVRGQPFDGFPDEWVDVEMFRTDIVATVIDLAVTVAEGALLDDHPALAFRAARAGLRASPYEERLFRLAMRAADAEGSTGKLRALMNELHRVLDVQIEPDDRMQRETIALYEELTSAVHRRARV
jgi:DNA-binding SARP family transcriptional activator